MTLLTGSAPFQNINMSALDLRRYIATVVASEGVGTSADLAVAQRAAGANMSVDIAAGEALVQGDNTTAQGFYWAVNDAVVNLTGFTAAHGTLPRIDRVVLRVRDTAHGGAADDEAFAILTGTATSGATLVNTTGAVTPGNNELLLANILVPAAATTITTANIDTTGASNNSPFVRPTLALTGIGVRRGTLVGNRPYINFSDSFTVTDDPANNEIDVTFPKSTRGQQNVTLLTGTAQATQNVTHTLGSTPSVVLVTFQSVPYCLTAGGASTPVLASVDSYGATTFRIVLSTDSGLNLSGGNQTYTMAWLAVA